MPDSLSSLFDRVGGQRRALIIAVGVVAAAMIFAVAQWAGAPTWVPAVTGLPLESVSALTDKLDQSAVKYRLERGGADIMVATTDLARARVALAKGGLPNAGRPGLELFDQPSWGMTDFTQRINYRRALEGELERVVGKMRGIDAAQVHLVMHETDGFAAQDRPTEASVVLKLKGEPDREVVKGISHLVASSVEGLTSDRVTIVDDAGRLLSEGEEAGSATGLTSRQLSMQRETEEYNRLKVEQLVAQMVGVSNFRVQVSAAMSFDRVERSVASVDPEKQAVAAEQKADITPSAGQAGAAQNNTSTTYENTRSTENFVAAPGTIKRLSVAVLVADRAPAPGVKNAKSTPRTAAELEQIRTMVRSAVGADSARGDVVSVVSMPFAPSNVAPVEAAKTDIIKVVQTAQRPLLGILGLVLIIIVLLISMRTIKGGSGSIAGPILSLPRGEQSPQMALQPTIDLPAMPTNTMRDRVNASIEQQPDAAARVVRAWLKEA